MKVSTVLSEAQVWQRKKFVVLGRITGCWANLENLLPNAREVIDTANLTYLNMIVEDLKKLSENVKSRKNPYKRR